VFGGNWSSRHYTSLDPSDWENVPGQGLPAPIIVTVNLLADVGLR
jgi:hypothetical protein